MIMVSGDIGGLHVGISGGLAVGASRSPKEPVEQPSSGGRPEWHVRASKWALRGWKSHD